MTADGGHAARGPGQTASRRGRVGRTALLGLLVVVVLVQLVVLYAPVPASDPMFTGADKVVHVLVFLLPTAVGLFAGGRPAVVVGVLAAHAVLSEVVQHLLLPARSGDPLDVVADLVGVGLGLLLWRAVLARRATAG